MSSPRVLVVDDEEELAFATAARLKLRGIEADVCTTPEQALEQTSEKVYDVAIIDMKLPGMDGVQLMARVREKRPSLQVILLAGYGSEEERAEGLKGGAVDYLAKPFNIDELAQTIISLRRLNTPVDDACSSPAGREGLGFLGKITASATHELKNVLAIIGQQAGLIDDILLMSEDNSPVDRDRIKKIAGKIAHQVAKGDQVARRLNRFAHSTDATQTRFDLVASLKDVVDAAERLAGLKRATLEVKVPANEIIVSSDPFAWQRLAFGCIELLISVAHEGSVIGVSLAGERADVSLSITGDTAPGEAATQGLTKLKALAGVLETRLDLEVDGTGRCSITMRFRGSNGMSASGP